MRRFVLIAVTLGLVSGVATPGAAFDRPNDPASDPSYFGTTPNAMTQHRAAIRNACTGNAPCSGHAPVIHIDRTDYYIDGMAYWDDYILKWDAMYIGYRRQPYTVPTIQLTNTPHPQCDPNYACAWPSPSTLNLCWIYVHPDWRTGTDRWKVGSHEIGHCIAFTHERPQTDPPQTGYDGVMISQSALSAPVNQTRDKHICTMGLYRCPYTP